MKGRSVYMLHIEVKLECEFSMASLGVKEVSTGCETSHNAGGGGGR